MPRYMVLKRILTCASGESMQRLYFPGETLDYDGAPGSSFAPMDAEARAAKKAWLSSRRAVARGREEREERRGRASLGNTPKRELAAAEAAMLEGSST